MAVATPIEDEPDDPDADRDDDDDFDLDDADLADLDDEEEDEAADECDLVGRSDSRPRDGPWLVTVARGSSSIGGQDECHSQDRSLLERFRRFQLFDPIRDASLFAARVAPYEWPLRVARLRIRART